jgi:hypothetical protein
MHILAQFLLRLAFGLAFGMAITSPRQVTSGYFRNHLYITLGLCTLAVLVLSPRSSAAAWLAAAAALLSFFGAASWLYEAPKPGKVVLWLVALASLVAAVLAGTSPPRSIASPELLWTTATIAFSGLVLGLTMAAMLLGHWYLNSPGMSLAPLRRLIAAAAIAVGAQAILSGYDVAATWGSTSDVANHWLVLVALRWSFGICGVLALFWMAWRTLDIPNTQSATGILYVAVIGVFVGELAAALLSAPSSIAL